MQDDESYKSDGEVYNDVMQAHAAPNVARSIALLYLLSKSQPSLHEERSIDQETYSTRVSTSAKHLQARARSGVITG